MDQRTIDDCKGFILNQKLSRKNVNTLVKEKMLNETRSIKLINELNELRPFISYIDGKIGKPTDFYKKYAITRQVYSNMNRNNYDPSIRTIYKILIGLHCDIFDAIYYLELGGYSLTFRSREQLVIIYCIINQIFNTTDVDELLVDQNVKPLFSI